jgi:type III secretion protein V
MIQSLHKGLNAVGRRQDMVVVILLVTAIMMMILPLPTWLVDALIGINLASAVLLLMMALYLKNPLDFSTLPSIILITTIFRLALSITTTRLILLQADAGEIIETFGNFVIAGELIVGLVVFLIITIVQFVVITKGSERVAEVAARFTLDALPGKQMSIDSDLRNGDIEQHEARLRRGTLEQESQFFGAMDGAMKFVKGDAIAGLVIVAVNLIGGISIGMFRKGMSAGEAVDVYSLLTVGDGLAAQLPALFVSLAAGSVITRVATEETENLGTDITRQMMSSSLALRVAAVILLVMMFIPGFPWPVFLIIGAIFMAISFADPLRAMVFGQDDDNDDALDHDHGLDASRSPFVVYTHPDLVSEEDVETFIAEASEATLTLNAEIGLTILPPRLVTDEKLKLGNVRVELDDVAVGHFVVDPVRIGVETSEDMMTLADLEGELATSPPPEFGSLYWVDKSATDAVNRADLLPLEPVDILLRGARALQTRYASQCVGVQEARAALAEMSIQYPDLAAEVRDLLPLTKVAEVFRRLIDEGVPVRNHRLLLESLSEWGAKEQDPVVLTEYVRTALRRQICNSLAGPDRVIPVYLLDSQVEDAVRDAIRQTTVGEYLALDDAISGSLVEVVTSSIREPGDGGSTPVVLSSLDVRRFVRSLLSNNGMRHIPVLSYQDLSNEFTVVPVTTIMLPRMNQAAE